MKNKLIRLGKKNIGGIIFKSYEYYYIFRGIKFSIYKDSGIGWYINILQKQKDKIFYKTVGNKKIKTNIIKGKSAKNLGPYSTKQSAINLAKQIINQYY